MSPGGGRPRAVAGQAPAVGEQPVEQRISAVWREHGDPLLAPTGRGALDGLRVAVKDLFAVGGYRIGAGNPAYLAGARVQAEDAAAVRALRAAGAAVTGIAQTDELAFSLSGTNTHYGTPPNPAAPDLVSGGSTSGPASAVAAGLVDVGLGTDTAGSIRVPASVCGLYGFRPTHGAVAVDGLVGLAPSFDTVGWLATDPDVLRSVGDILLPPEPAPHPPTRLLVVGPPDGAEKRSAERAVVGESATRDGTLTHGPLPVGGGTGPTDRTAAVAARLADALGVRLVVGPVREDDDVPGLLAAFRAVQARQAWLLHGAWIEAHPGALAADVEARFRFGTAVDADTLRGATRTIAEGRARLLDRLGLDTWLVRRATAGPGHRRAADAETRDAWRLATLGCTVVASAYGLPSCVVPMRAVGPGPQPPPVGVAIVGPPGADRALLEAAVALGRPATL